MADALATSNFEALGEPRRGKVRDVYDLGDTLLIVACDRISAYDHVLQPAIPGKGKVLTQLSNFWFELLSDVVPHHLLATQPEDFPFVAKQYAAALRGRAVLVRKTQVVPFECVARGFLAGSAFREYTETGRTCGIQLPSGLRRADRLPEPIFTPATKAESGHDENIDFATLLRALGEDLAIQLRDLTLEIYSKGRDHATAGGMLLADTKFEFGQLGDQLYLIDEVLTPDSSRYWDAEEWTPGTEPASFDKQYVRNWLDAEGWDHESTPPTLPDQVVAGTLERYVEAFRRVTGRDPVL